MAEFRIGRRGRRTNIPKQIYLDEARAAANAVGQVLVGKYGQHSWILQVMEGVQSFVDRGIKQLSGTQAPVQNAVSGDQHQYAMHARTGAEVMQANPNIMQRPADIPLPTQQQVQQQLPEENNDMFAVLSRAADPATQRLGQGVPGQAMPVQQQPLQQTASGLVLPAGAAPQPVQGVQNEGAGAGHDPDSVSWLL